MPNVRTSLSRRGGLPVLLAAGLFAAGLAPTAAAAGNVPSGAAFAWGLNNAGQAGGSPSANPAYNLPNAMAGLGGGVAALAAGDAHSLALFHDGSVFAWGNDSEGQVGNDATFQPVVPMALKVPLPGKATAIAAGARHSLALLADGTVWAWGENADGALGDGTTTNRGLPVKVLGVQNAVAIAAGGIAPTAAGPGGDHSLAVLSDGRVMAWGYGTDGQLGLGGGQLTSKTIAAQVANISNATAVAAGGRHSLALLKDGKIAAWGSDVEGALGDEAAHSPAAVATPVTVAGITDAVQIGAGQLHSAARLADGTVETWGSDDNGQLGDDTALTDHVTPVPVAGITDAVDLAVGKFHNLAVLGDGTVRAWGNDATFQLGDGTNSPTTNNLQATPVPVLGLTDAFRAAAGLGHSLALRSTTGPAGPQGPAGPAGPAGQNGSPGQPGQPGPAGPQGPAAPAPAPAPAPAEPKAPTSDAPDSTGPDGTGPDGTGPAGSAPGDGDSGAAPEAPPQPAPKDPATDKSGCLLGQICLPGAGGK